LFALIDTAPDAAFADAVLMWPERGPSGDFQLISQKSLPSFGSLHQSGTQLSHPSRLWVKTGIGGRLACQDIRTAVLELGSAIGRACSQSAVSARHFRAILLRQ
jgi:hypothetical protein